MWCSSGTAPMSGCRAPACSCGRTTNFCGQLLLSNNLLKTMCGLVAQRIRHLTTNQGIAGSSPAKVNIFGQLTQPDKNSAPPGGLEPPTFRLTAERASRLRHGGLSLLQLLHHWNRRAKICFLVSRECLHLYVHNKHPSHQSVMV